MTDEGLVRYARDLAAEVDEAIHSGEGAVYSEEEFTRLVLDKLGDDGALDNPVLLYQEGTFGRTKYKITGFSIPETEDRLLLVTTVHTGDLPPRDLTHEEIQTAVTRAANFYKCSCDGLHAKIDPSNTEASDLARRISEIHHRIEVLRVVLLSDGLLGLRPPLDIKDAKDGTRVLVDLYGIERLHRLLGEGLTRDDIGLDVVAESGAPLPCLKASGAGADYDAYMTAIPASILADIYEKYGTRLLELNVRAFLGVRGRKSVNAGLRHTILEEPTRFLAYNNGIVATADEIDVASDGRGNLAIRSLRGLQIVNGGQTTASLQRARRRDKADLSGITVPAKIIKVKGENLDAMVAAVSRSANSQNTVQPADFSANDPFHVTVEVLANNTWLPDQRARWFYERARGSYGASEFKASLKAAERRRFASETPKERRFSKTDLAKYLNAWDDLPHQVSFGNQKNFQSFMQSLKEQYPEGFVPDEEWYRPFIAKAIVFRTTKSTSPRIQSRACRGRRAGASISSAYGHSSPCQRNCEPCSTRGWYESTKN
jgi:AIPR protein/Abortive infection phage resistance protein N-terminal domain